VKSASIKWFLVVVVLSGLAAVLIWFLVSTSSRPADKTLAGKEVRPMPVEVMPIEHGPIELRRIFSGALEPRAEFIVSPKVGGRVERLSVNISDSVNRGQLVGALDNEEYVQAVAQARADLAVAEANLEQTRSALEIADRELTRIETLRKRGVASESQLDTAKANQQAKRAEYEVARAQAMRADSALKTTNIRLDYTKIIAGWSGGEDQRVVAERFVDEGEMVSANTPLLRIVELDPIAGVIFVAERDYALLHPGLPVVLTTDAYPGEKFHGHIERIAPVFKQASRQARVELSIDNPQQRLKPGMFIRATVVLDRKTNAVILPEQAVTTREGRTGVFLVAENGRTAVWREVTVGIRDGSRLQVKNEALSGQVVTLGQQMLDDGSPITIPGVEETAAATDDKAIH
jgi:RND family efflux transporter MFP subunit